MEHDIPLPEPTPDEDDVEGHAFKWAIQEDAKGGKRLSQGWDPDSAPPGRPERPRQPEQPKGR
jgi:hypothetical protein